MSGLRQSVLSRGAMRFLTAGGPTGAVNWSKYFVSQRQIATNGNKFNVYSVGDTGPLLVTLHGGGYSALTWSLFAESIMKKIECQLLAIDLRGHGSTVTDNDENLSLEVMSRDVVDVLEAIYGTQTPPMILIGHSMGGAVAVEVAPLLPNLVGLCVIDVVEGTALDSLASMQSLLRSRPTSFKSVEQAVEWSFRGGQTRNLAAARVSMPGQIRNSVTGELAANESDLGKRIAPVVDPSPLKLVHSVDAIREESEEDANTPISPTIPASSFKLPDVSAINYEWRIDLSKTEPYWKGWFKGLSQKFLDIRAPKVLLLANIQGLDTALTIGQMQGKFQMQVLQRSGHAIHEDQPNKVAEIIGGFLVKQKVAVPKFGFTPIMPAC